MVTEIARTFLRDMQALNLRLGQSDERSDPIIPVGGSHIAIETRRGNYASVMVTTPLFIMVLIL